MKLQTSQRKFRSINPCKYRFEDEKLQTAVFKQDHMRELFPSHRVVYFYCLSDWFKENAKAELKFLEKNDIKVFWGSDPEYKEKVVAHLNSY